MSHKYLNINWDYLDKPIIKEKRYLKYFPPPPIISTQFEYQDVNKDSNLRKLITNFYLKKSIKWISTYDEFEHCKKILFKIKSDNGYNIIYNLLKQYIDKNNANWYDLKKSYSNVKDFLRYKLGKL